MRWPVMLFAAGFGTRMKHLTQDRPKPMIEVAGRPLIDHALALAEQLPAATVVVNLHYRPELLRRHLEGRRVRIILEQPEILDTGGGLRNALPLLGGNPVMTLNSDAVWQGSNPLRQLEAAWQPEKMDALLIGIDPKRAVGYSGVGDFTPMRGGQVKRGPGLIYGGAQIINTEFLHRIDAASFSLNRVWDLILQENRLYAAEYDGVWCDVGHPGGIPLAEKLLRGEDV
jgi:MurNAc alpha-1-phosphate uridylyltransferase